MTTKEDDEKIETTFSDQVKFFCRYYGLTWFLVSQLGMAYFAVMRSLNDICIATWTENPDIQQQ